MNAKIVLILLLVVECALVGYVIYDFNKGGYPPLWLKIVITLLGFGLLRTALAMRESQKSTASK